MSYFTYTEPLARPTGPPLRMAYRKSTPAAPPTSGYLVPLIPGTGPILAVPGHGGHSYMVPGSVVPVSGFHMGAPVAPTVPSSRDPFEEMSKAKAICKKTIGLIRASGKRTLRLQQWQDQAILKIKQVELYEDPIVYGLRTEDDVQTRSYLYELQNLITQGEDLSRL